MIYRVVILSSLHIASILQYTPAMVKKKSSREGKVAFTLHVEPRAAKRFTQDVERTCLSQSRYFEALVQRCSADFADQLESLLTGKPNPKPTGK